MYEFFKQVQLTGINGWKPFKITTEANLAAIWRMLERGGGAKSIEYPCHCCPITSFDLAHPASKNAIVGVATNQTAGIVIITQL